jgi:hypothetical protein
MLLPRLVVEEAFLSSAFSTVGRSTILVPPSPGLAREAAASRLLRAVLASPSEMSTMWARAFSSTFREIPPRPLSLSSKAFLRISPRTGAVYGFRTRTRTRESRGAMTSKEGFSVVAPMRVMRPLSTWGRKASCWALLNRWISSTKRTVLRRKSRSLFSASSTTARISFTPERTRKK